MSIKNGDLPAMPVYNPQGEVVSEFDLEDMKNNFNVSLGISKREMFAMNAMQGILSGFSTADIANESKRSGMRPNIMIACMATEMADALLAELEKSK